jgi:hypothetical protein
MQTLKKIKIQEQTADGMQVGYGPAEDTDWAVLISTRSLAQYRSPPGQLDRKTRKFHQQFSRHPRTAARCHGRRPPQFAAVTAPPGRARAMIGGRRHRHVGWVRGPPPFASPGVKDPT